MRYEYLSIHISLNFKGILPQKDVHVKYLEFIFIDKIGIAYICKTSALFSQLNININNVLKFMEHEIALYFDYFISRLYGILALASQG